MIPDDLPIKSCLPNNISLMLWRGCDFSTLIPIQNQIEMIIGQDLVDEFPVSEGNNKTAIYRTAPIYTQYQSAKFQIYSSWAKSNKLLFELDLQISYPFDDNDDYFNEIRGEARIGVPSTFGIGDTPLYIYIPWIMTKEFDFNEGVFSLEMSRRILDDNGEPLLDDNLERTVDRLLIGDITVLGEKP